jgi:ketosteroid isomerase-like protein
VVAFRAVFEDSRETPMRVRVPCFLLVVLLLPIEALAANTAAQKAAAAILDADRRFSQSVEERSRERFVALVAKDAVFLGGGYTRGKDAVAADWAPFLAPARKTTIRWSPKEAHVSSSADLGFTLGEYTLESTDAEGHKQVKRGHYLSVWRKQPDGSWQVVADAGSPAELEKRAP